MLRTLVLATLTVALTALHTQLPASHFLLAAAQAQPAVTGNPAFDGQFDAITA
jgi:hypothetical protein